MKKLPKVFIVVGGRGSGKTTFLEKNVENPLIISLFDDGRYKGCDRIPYYNVESIIGECPLEIIYNRNVIVEDATQLFFGNVPLIIRRLVVSSKQVGSNIYLVFHSFQAVPSFLWHLFDYCIVFDCSSLIKTNYLAEYEEIINEIQKKNTKKYKIKGIFQKK